MVAHYGILAGSVTSVLPKKNKSADTRCFTMTLKSMKAREGRGRCHRIIHLISGFIISSNRGEVNLKLFEYSVAQSGSELNDNEYQSMMSNSNLIK